MPFQINSLSIGEVNLYENWFPGKILEYKNIFGLKRFLDDFDYISLINDGVKI